MNKLVKYESYERNLMDELMLPISSGLTDIMDDLSILAEASEILFITSFPPRECGIATYSQDLIQAISNKFGTSVPIRICAVESENDQHRYGNEVSDVLLVNEGSSFENMKQLINQSEEIRLVVIQHEFGLFDAGENYFMEFLAALNKPVALVFHTIIPQPSALWKEKVNKLSSFAASVIVMTKAAEQILTNDYHLENEKITVIPHGTHLVPNGDKNVLKKKYALSGKKVLATFGLLSSGKGIENTLTALPSIVSQHPDVLFLIIGKTHPSIVKAEGEKYRDKLMAIIDDLKLEKHVRFINQFLPLPALLDYLQLTDIYLFTSTDPNQAVSGTISYAMSSGCPIISTPFPHAKEVLTQQEGILIDFNAPEQLSKAVNVLLSDDQLRSNISINGLQRMASTAWENAALAHTQLFDRLGKNQLNLEYQIPAIKLDHVRKLTTEFGMIQFSIINRPDINSGYTLDDNARALIAVCMHFENSNMRSDLVYIDIYLRFIEYCLQPEGNFLNYVDENHDFTLQNQSTNLEDSNGRALWALGYLLSMREILPLSFIEKAEHIFETALPYALTLHSTRALAFTIKGLYYRSAGGSTIDDLAATTVLANRLMQMYVHEADGSWNWFESYLTYANSLLPESLLCAWLLTGNIAYKEISKTSFDFLLGKLFKEGQFSVISNKGWLHKGQEMCEIIVGGEQPIDVAYTIMALEKFNQVFPSKTYLMQLEQAFDWFLGNNHLNQIVYNPCTGGCYDGVEESYVNLNQGAESTVSYLMARMVIERTKKEVGTKNFPPRLAFVE